MFDALAKAAGEMETRDAMEKAARERGRRFVHYLQTNLISNSPAWKDVIFDMFNGSVGTSMDFPNHHRKLFSGSVDDYSRNWRQRLGEARAAGIRVGVIAVLHQGSLAAGADACHRHFVEELGLP